VRVFLATPIRGVAERQEIYRLMYTHLVEMGIEVEGAFWLSDERGLDDEEIYERDIAALERSDVLLAEVSSPSTGVGFEVAHALCRGIPVVCVHERGVRLSAMIAGCPEVHLYEYSTPDELCSLLKSALTRL